jgi:hypothetical protein
LDIITECRSEPIGVPLIGPIQAHCDDLSLLIDADRRRPGLGVGVHPTLDDALLNFFQAL